MNSDLELVQRYAETGDPDAFAAIISRYQNLVYGTCVRIHGRADPAEDSAQQCFVRLAREADQVRSSLPGWLHRCATRTCLQAIRSQRARRHRELAYAELKAHQEPAVLWEQIAPQVDQALDELPDELRQVLVEHFLHQRTQAQIAERAGVSAATISRRIGTGLDALRRRLTKAGVIAPAAILAAALSQQSAQAAPASLATAVKAMLAAQLAQTPIAAGTAGSSAAGALLGTLYGKVMAVALISAAVATATAVQKHSSSTEAAMGKINYSQVSLAGDSATHDPFSLTVAEAARLLGIETDHETVYILSTNAFAPDLRPDEPCRCCWRLQGRERCLDLVTARLGMTVRELPDAHDSASPAPNDPTQTESWLVEHFRKPLVPIIRNAMADGRVVISRGEWDPAHASWVLWGIVTDAKDDGTILGATLNGRTDNPIVFLRQGYALARSEPKLDQRQADLAVLQRAVDRIRGERAPFAPGQIVFGVKAMDVWIAQMQGSFQPADPPWFDGDADDPVCKLRAKLTASSTYQGAQAAAKYLRQAARRLPQTARPHLTTAADHYDRIVELLHPAMTGQGGESYDQLIGDIQKQKNHAANVLTPIKAELAAAANAMEKALAASHADTLSLDDVPAGQGEGNPFAMGLSVILNYGGTPADYDTLMGDLGLAFIFQASDQVTRYDGALDVGWWPLDPECIPTYLEFVSRTVGQRIDYIRADEPSYHANAKQHYHQRFEPIVRAELSAGRPLLANNGFWTVVTACDTNDSPLSGHCPCTTEKQTERLDWPSKYPWRLAILSGPATPLARKLADRQAIGHAVALARDEVTMPQGFLTGQKAFALWAQTLRDFEHRGQARWHANARLHLVLNRRSADAYLRAMADRHPQNVAQRLLAAADLYRQVIDAINAADISDQALIESTAGREHLAQRIERVAELEAQAADELQSAAQAMEAQ